MSPLDSALVLGSAQPAGTVTSRAGGDIGIVRRRSGGGAVLVEPEASVWIDVVIGRYDPLWDDDVNRAPMWLGQVWASALASLGVTGAEVCRRYDPGAWGRVACFASRGPGEVVIGEAKAVGVAQRRTRTTARFQTLSYLRWTPDELVARLSVPPEQSDELREALASAASPIPAGTEHVRAAFLEALVALG